MQKLAISLILGFFSTFAQAALITSSTVSALDGATVIDFESQAFGSSTSYTIGDVTFSNAGTGTLEIADYTYGGVYGTTGRELSTRTSRGSFNIDFDAPVSAFGMNWGAADGYWNMYVYDDSNNLLESLFIPAQTSPYVGYIGSDAGNMSHIELVGQYSDWVKIDDFAYVGAGNTVTDPTVSVPQPATLALLGMGLIGMAVGRRRANKA